MVVNVQAESEFVHASLPRKKSERFCPLRIALTKMITSSTVTIIEITRTEVNFGIPTLLCNLLETDCSGDASLSNTGL
jgi:hypothetical protein